MYTVDNREDSVAARIDARQARIGEFEFRSTDRTTKLAPRRFRKAKWGGQWHLGCSGRGGRRWHEDTPGRGRVMGAGQAARARLGGADAAARGRSTIAWHQNSSVRQVKIA